MSNGPSAPPIDLDEVVNCIKSSVRRASNEEETRIWVSKCIEDKILKPLGILQYSHYEYTLISGARVDALYGHVIVEYKAPGKLSSASDIAKAKEQVIGYIQKESYTKTEWDRYLGIIISDRIAFVRYYSPQGTWILRGPYDITRESVIKFIEAIRGLKRRALKVDFLLEDFGPKSGIAKKAVNVIHKKLLNFTSPRTEMLFKDWMRLFKQATGYSPEKLSELKKLASEYGIKDKKFDELIFAIQTYYAIIMKLLAAEVVYLYGGGKFYKSYIAELEDRYARGGAEALRDALNELESGGIFKKFGYENFLEGDYFSWYLGEMDEELADTIAEIARKLGNYEPATPQLEPEYARDLLKRLYQHLVPRDIRKSLGEYYTPDWLADLLLDEVGLSVEKMEKIGEKNSLEPLQLRVLDPACGSGTFLVRYISRLRAYAREHFLDDVLADYLLNNVVGYDLNPLAVLTARTNYLLMIADLPKRGNIELPIYLTDSLMVEKRTTISGNAYELKTIVGEFQLPVKVVEGGLLPRILSEITNSLSSRYRPEDFRNRIKYVFKELEENELEVLTNLYSALLKLEFEGKDSVWVAIIRNAFAPVLRGKFDYIIGNPPWINWENLPEDYREASKDLWMRYGLAEIRGGKGLGKVKRDLAMLFLVRCFDLYLKQNGKQAFLIPFTVFKTQAGAGFRKFLANKTKIQIIHDLVTTYPFEGAVNRTSAVVIEKICELNKIGNECPEINNAVRENKKIRHVIWVSEKAVPTDSQVEEVLKTTKRSQAIMTPISEGDVSSSWMQVTEKVLPHIRRIIVAENAPPHIRRIIDASNYKAHVGVCVSLNQVYFVKIKEKLPDGKLLITNPCEPGQKKKVEEKEEVVEPDLVYPLIRGRDVKKWYVDYKDRYIIVPHDPKDGKPLEEKSLKEKYPLTYHYLDAFRTALENRAIHKLWGKGNPFYAVYDIGRYTFAPYKVVWKYIAGAITGKATAFECAVLEPINGNVAIPHEKLILIPFERVDEAYYVAGVLNSSVVRMIVASYVIETEISTHIIKIIKVPKFDSNNLIHQEIAKLSKKAHEIARCIHSQVKPEYCMEIRNPEEELRKVEEEIDKLVAKLYEIPDEALQEIKRLLSTLKAEEVAEETEEEKEEILPSIDFLKTDVIADQKDYIEVQITTAEQCEEVELTLEGPLGVKKQNLPEGKHKIYVKLPAGIYDIQYKLVCGDNELRGNVTITSSGSSPKAPKRPRTLKLK